MVMKLSENVQIWISLKTIINHLVQLLNSPFFPLHIGAEPGRAKRESRITCMPMLWRPPFFPPKSGEKPYLQVLSRFGLWCNFLNFCIKTCQLIPNQCNRPFAAKPSRDPLFIKLWAATARNGKSMSTTSKRPSLKPLALKNEILWWFQV